MLLDLAGVESALVRAAGGTDNVVVNDLAGTRLGTVDVDLNAPAGGGDGQADTVTVNGTNGPDVVDVSRSGSQVLTTDLAAQTRIVGSEPTNDTLRVQTLGGHDTVTVGAGVSDLIIPVVDLGADD